MSLYHSKQGATAPFVITIVAIVAVIGLIAWALQSAGPQPEQPTGDAMQKNEATQATNSDDAMIEKNTNEALMEKKEEGAMMEKDGSAAATQVKGYVTYTADVFAQAAAQRRVLYFHADWCPVCRPLNLELQARQGELPDDVVVFKVNYDTEKTLKTRYGVTYQHTFVQVDAAGNAVTKWNGGDVDDLLDRII